MKKVGELVQEAIEEMSKNSMEAAFALSCVAIEATLKKTLETEDLARADYEQFINRHLGLIAFTGLPRALPLPRDVESKLKAIVHGFYIRNAEEMLLHLIMQTARMGRLPLPFKFHFNYGFEVRDHQIYIPASLVGGLIGIVIFQPANKDETVSDRYWINISDFKMFVSELWGRIDLAERIMNLR